MVPTVSRPEHGKFAVSSLFVHASPKPNFPLGYDLSDCLQCSQRKPAGALVSVPPLASSVVLVVGALSKVHGSGKSTGPKSFLALRAASKLPPR